MSFLYINTIMNTAYGGTGSIFHLKIKEMTQSKIRLNENVGHDFPLSYPLLTQINHLDFNNLPN